MSKKTVINIAHLERLVDLQARVTDPEVHENINNRIRKVLGMEPSKVKTVSKKRMK